MLMLAVLGLPQRLVAEAGPSLTGAVNGRQFRLVLQGRPNQVYEIQASVDLKHWTPIAKRTRHPPMES